jgi:hypothetical protein
MTQTDRQLLLDVADGDMSAALAFLDRLEETGDTRLNDTRRVIGKLINGVLDTWQDKDCDDSEARIYLASERTGLLDQARHDLFELFWCELMDCKDVALVGQQLAESARLLNGPFEDDRQENNC